MLKDLKKIDGGFEDQEGCFWESLSDYICIGVLSSCGCGDPESIGKYVKEMFLKHVKLFGSNDYLCWDKTDYDDLATMFFLCWANKEGYTEHGSTIRCSWMTEKGQELLEDLIKVLT